VLTTQIHFPDISAEGNLLELVGQHFGITRVNDSPQLVPLAYFLVWFVAEQNPG
jgi:hypothetical protein